MTERSMRICIPAAWVLLALLGLSRAAEASCEPAARCKPSAQDCKECEANSYYEGAGDAAMPAVQAGPEQGIDFTLIDSCLTVTVMMTHAGQATPTKVGGHFNALNAFGMPKSTDEILTWMKAKIAALHGFTPARILVAGKKGEWSDNLTQSSVRLSTDDEYRRAVGPLQADIAGLLHAKSGDDALVRAPATSKVVSALAQIRIRNYEKQIELLNQKIQTAGEPHLLKISIDKGNGLQKLCTFLQGKLAVPANTACAASNFTESKVLKLDKAGAPH